MPPQTMNSVPVQTESVVRPGGALTVDVNEDNLAARAFYEALAFTVVGRSADDSTGRPYAILHMRRGVSPASVVHHPAEAR
jgi:hypothetical protein